MKKTLTILDQIAVAVEVLDNPYDFHLKDLFLVAARNNTKRAFLFVSKLLGKHIPVDPKRALLTGRLLGFLVKEKVEKSGGRGYQIDLIAKALKEDKYIHEAFSYAENNPINLDKATLFMGFAETATALGNSVFSQFKGENVYYIHTTRDELIEYLSAFNFEEEHSHATSHFCYPLKNNMLEEYKRIVLVDDEITTGKTALNLIRAINNKFPGKEYVVVSILDWRRKEHIEEYKKLEKELGIVIKEVSLLDGEATCNSPSLKGIDLPYEKDDTRLDNIDIYEQYYENGILYEASSKFPSEEEDRDKILVKHQLFTWEQSRKLTRRLSGGQLISYKYLDLSGRFGITVEELEEVENFTTKVARQLGSFQDNTIVLGTEEFMYIPMILASKLQGAKYQSTTRSPIHANNSEEYGVQSGAKFNSPFDKEVINYIYNIKKGMYKEVLFITEREVDENSKAELIRVFYLLGIYNINFIYFLKS